MVSTVSVSVLIIAVLLTALVTTAIFTCIACLTLRSRTRRREYEQEQDRIETPPPVHTPHIIDLHKSFSGNSPRLAGIGSTANLELSNVDHFIASRNNSYSNNGGSGSAGSGIQSHSRTPSVLSPRLEPAEGFIGLGVHVRGDSIGGSKERLLASPIPQAKLSR
jgi:hypothetical protein